jgi:hypothetical protein
MSDLSGAAGWEVAAPIFFFAAVILIGAFYLWWPRA